jgi:WD40 repeat protein
MAAIWGQRWRLATLAVWLACPSGKSGAEETGRPWLEPQETRTVSLPAFETTSTSPFGGSRLGGRDTRSYDISPDGSLLVTQDPGIWQLELFDLHTGQSVARFGKIEEPTVVAFAPDGRTVVTATWGSSSSDRTVSIWDVEQRRHARDLDEGVSLMPFSSLAFSPDGNILALGARVRNETRPTIHLWSAESGMELARFPRPAADPTAPRAVGPRGAAARVFPRRVTDSLPGQPFGPIAIALDGRSLVVAADERVTLVEIASGRERAVVDLLPPPFADKSLGIATPARSLTWLGPRELAIGCHDGLIRRYDVVSGERLLPLSGHQGEVAALRVVPDRRHLLSFGRDGKLCRWDLEAVRQATPPPPQDISDGEWQRHWKSLAEADLQQHHRARLAIARSVNGVRLLTAKVSPAENVNADKAAALARGIASEDYNERRQAAAQLHALGELAIPILRQAAATRENELASRFLSRLESRPVSSETARKLQAVSVLLESGSRPARDALTALAQGAPGADLTHRATQALELMAEPAATDQTAATLDALWEQLAAEDAELGWRAIKTLLARGDALPFVRERVAAVKERLAADEEPRSIDRLIEQLDAEEFAEREAASQALRELGVRLHPLLRERLAKTDSSEQKMRLERLLQEKGDSRPSGLRLQVERAAEVLFLSGDTARDDK